VVFFIILVISIVQWFIDGKKNFIGPRVNVDVLQNGEVQGMAPVFSSEQGSSSNFEKSSK
jgi:choline transport protein